MGVIDVSYEIHAPKASVWDLIADFYNIESWWPNPSDVKIERVEIEGEGIGGIRHIFNEGFENAVSERLDYLDEEAGLWQLSIVCDRPFGLTQYQATGKLEELDSTRCRLTYNGEFETEPGREDEARAFLVACYDFMKEGLETVAQQRSKQE